MTSLQANLIAKTTLVLLSFFLTFIQVGKGGLNCRENPCSCCKSGECTRPDQHVFPCHGCKDGYTNPSCYENCPTNCVNCSQLFYENDAERICYQCKNGFYKGQYKDIKSYPLQQDCSLACVDNCDICTSFYNCISCKENHYLVYGRDCIPCPLNCSQCLPDAGCVACIDGHVWTGRVCEPCKSNCKRCELSGECSECYSGFYLHGGSCNKCPSGCLTCDGLKDCNKCKEGYVLKDSTCCSNCSQGKLCKRSSGYCSDSCKDGWSGKNCDLPCDSSCQSCDKENPEKCVKCVSNRYGPLCGNECSRNCLNHTCNDLHGICIYGCLSGFWGERCENDCPTNCVERQCERDDGLCSKGCIDTYRGDTCVCSINCTCETEDDCVRCVDMNGTTCNTTCSEGCVEIKCEKTTNCLNGCLPDFAGSSSCIADGQQTKDTSITATTIVTITVIGAGVIFFGVCMVYHVKTKRIFMSKKGKTHGRVSISFAKVLRIRTCTETESEDNETSGVFLDLKETKKRKPPMETSRVSGRTEMSLPRPALSFTSELELTNGGAAMPCLPKQDENLTDISAKSVRSEEESEEKEVIDGAAMPCLPKQDDKLTDISSKSVQSEEKLEEKQDLLRGVNVRQGSDDNNDDDTSHTRAQSSSKRITALHDD